MLTGVKEINDLTPHSIFVRELPPPRPRACFGRDELIKKIVGLADNHNPVALIGPGGIGKTSLALAVLHHDRVKDRFGSNRRFIRCDEFPASRANFLRRLSKVIGAGIENPEGLVSLRSSLSSEEMFIVLDNAESILDPQGTDGSEIYRVVEELSQFDNICLCITSRITTLPPTCEALEVPTLPVEAARDAFYGIYKHDGRSDDINDILRQLDFHSLSVTLLATVAHQNKWNNSRLAREWERRQTGVLKTDHNNSLAATIELSLASPMFKELGPEARELLGVVAFYPQGVDENSLDWLFPAIPNINTIFDKFCILSLAYRSGDFVTMLAPLRDHLRPTSPAQSPLLYTTKELYFTRLSVDINPDAPTSPETQWIMLEDVNVEHLLYTFTSTDADSKHVWDACTNFIGHLYWHKQRETILQSKVERLPDDHPSKPGCLFHLSRLSELIGKGAERKSLLLRALALRRKEGNDYWIARTLAELAGANRDLGLCKEGIPQAKEASEIMERVGATGDQAFCLMILASLFFASNRLDDAHDAASRAINLGEKGQEFTSCLSHRILGNIYSSKGERKKAIHHYEVALGIATPFNWRIQAFWIHYSMSQLCRGGYMFDNAHAHISQAKLLADDNAYSLGRAMEEQAWIWYRQKRLEDAKSEASRAHEIYEKLRAVKDLGDTRDLLQSIKLAMESRATLGESGSSGELLEMIPRLTHANALLVPSISSSTSANIP